MEVEIREARLDDAAGISRVDIDSHRVAYAHIFGDGYMAGVEQTNVERWQRVLNGNPPPPMVEQWTLVAVLDARVEAYAALIPSRDADAVAGETGEVGAIYVHPDVWRRRVGSALMSASLDLLRAQGFVEVTLWMLEENRDAMPFYKSQGFALDGGRQIGERNTGRPNRVEVRYRRSLLGLPTT